MTTSSLPRVLIVLGLVAGFIGLSWFTLRMGIPGVIGGGQRAAQSAAVSLLRTLLWTQDRFIENRFADRDGDGRGEFGFLAELAGKARVKSGTVLDRPLLMGPAGQVVPGKFGGVSMVGGYCFVIYLPKVGGGAAAELPSGGEAPGTVDPDGAEKYWVAYAWPRAQGLSGRKVFYLNQDEEIWQSDGTGPGQLYDGPLNGPAFNAALPRPDLSIIPSETQPGGDGGKWVRWKGKQPRKKAE